MDYLLIALMTVMFLSTEVSSEVEITDGSKTVVLNHNVIINENYHLHWTYDDKIIYIQVSFVVLNNVFEITQMHHWFKYSLNLYD